METKRRGRVENLKPWKPGQSGNPGGRPKRKPITDRYLNELEEKMPDDPKGQTDGDALVQAMMREAIKGKVAAANEIADRVEGKPTTTIAAEDATLENLPLENPCDVTPAEFTDVSRAIRQLRFPNGTSTSE